MMGSFGILILVVIILIFWYLRKKEGFEVWPIPTPDEIGAPTAPAIMNFEERVAKGEIAPPKSFTGEGVKYDSVGGGDLYGAYGPGGYGNVGYSPLGLYPGLYPGMYPGLYPGMSAGMYGSQLSPLSFGGNTSGSTSIGGFGPALPSGMVTPASVRGSPSLAGSSMMPSAVMAQSSPGMSAGMATLASSMSAPSTLSAPATLTAQAAMAPSAVSAPLAQAPVAVGGGASRTKTIGSEVDIKGFDWAGLAAQSAAAFAPTETVEAPAATVSSSMPESPFETVAATNVMARETAGPHVTASTAVSLPTVTPSVTQQPEILTAKERKHELSMLNKQRFAQAMFGSVQLPNVMAPTENVNVAPLFSANAPVSALRGSRNQPGSILADSKSTQTIIDTAPGQIAAAVSQIPATLQQPALQQSASTGSSSVSA